MSLPATGDPKRDHRIAAIRGFNRFYTKQIGVLQDGLLESPFSLAEARLLYELTQREKATAAFATILEPETRHGWSLGRVSLLASSQKPRFGPPDIVVTAGVGCTAPRTSNKARTDAHTSDPADIPHARCAPSGSTVACEGTKRRQNGSDVHVGCCQMDEGNGRGAFQLHMLRRSVFTRSHPGSIPCADIERASSF